MDDDAVLAMGTVKLVVTDKNKSVVVSLDDMIALASSRLRSERFGGLHNHKVSAPAALLPEVNNNFSEAFMPLLRDALDEAVAAVDAYFMPLVFDDEKKNCTLTLRKADVDCVRIMCVLLRYALSLAESKMRRRSGAWDATDAERLTDEKMRLKEYMLTH